MQICWITLRFSFQSKLKNFKVKITEMACCVILTDFEIEKNIYEDDVQAVQFHIPFYINHIPTKSQYHNMTIVYYYVNESVM